MRRREGGPLARQVPTHRDRRQVLSLQLSALPVLPAIVPAADDVEDCFARPEA